VLFTSIPRRGYPWPPERGTIDRDLDVAISQFAPGSEIVKDKRVYRSAGVIDLSPAGETVQIRPGFKPPLIDDNGMPLGNLSLGFCRSCQSVAYLDRSSAPPVGGLDPQLEKCHVCGADAMSVVDAREPCDFFSCFSDDFDGTFEWVPRSTRPMICASAETLLPIARTNVSVHASATEVLSVNDNGGQGGFDFHSVTLPRLQGVGAYAVDTHFWEPLRTPSYRIALLSRRHTDVMIADLQTWPDGIYANPSNVQGRAAWYSFAFLLRIAAAAMLDVDAQELQAGIRTLEVGGMPRGQAFLSDNLENGAGYCRWLASEDNFVRLLSEACDLDGGQIASKWLANEHARHCDASCNECLRDFYNMQYNGLLDWRLALDMARIAQDSSAILDICTGYSDAIENPWRQLVKGDNSPISRVFTQFGYEATLVSQNQCYVSPRRNRVLIPCHPLWTSDNPLFIDVANAVGSTYPSFQIVAMNLYVALRRPADYA
jgi:DEAD/DEAH box helicase domain-containing protein